MASATLLVVQEDHNTRAVAGLFHSSSLSLLASTISGLRRYVSKMLQSHGNIHAYQPLSSERHIRYLQLQPASRPGDPLVCTLHSGPLSGCPDYEAVSYVWGSSQKPARISCDGSDLAVTASLDAVLRRLRRPDVERTIWADSICIDQGQPVERGHQVAMMGDIYRAAKNTVIVLGPDPGGHAPRLAGLVADLAARIRADQAALGITPPADNPLRWEDLPAVAVAADDDDPLALDARWPSYTALLDSPWFQRVWTAQEAALGGSPLILWGDDTQLAWAELIGVHRWLIMCAQRIWYRHRLMLNDVYEYSFWRPVWPMPNFVELLARAKTLGCTDDRDRVFAFLGSAKAHVVVGGDGEGVGADRGSMVTLPNYEKSVREVYRDFAADWLHKTGNLCLLSAVEHTPETLADPLVPSWAPRWDISLTGNYYGLFAPAFDASRGLDAVRPQLARQTCRLKVRGIVCGTVAWGSATLPRHISLETAATPQGIVARLLQALWNYRRPVSPTGTDVLGAAWKHLASASTAFAYDDRSRLQAFAQAVCRQAYRNGTVTVTVPVPPEKLHADEAAFALAVCRATDCFGDADPVALEKDAQGGCVDDFLMHANIWASRRRFVATSDGLYALAPLVAEAGDQLCVLAGMKVPVLLRRDGQTDCYKLVGEAFVLGMMDGEAVDRASESGAVGQDLFLC